MSLFQCENCGCCENTALSGQGCNDGITDYYSWVGIEDRKGLKLCSVCAPTHYAHGGLTDFGIWHDCFERVFLPKGLFKTSKNGNLEHIENGDQNYKLYRIQIADVDSI